MTDHVHAWSHFGYAVQRCQTCDALRPQPGFECRVCKGIPEHFEPCHTSVCNACRTTLGLSLRGGVKEEEFFEALRVQRVAAARQT